MKSGFKTSEFWLRLLTKALGLAVVLLGMAQPTPLVQAIGTMCGAALAYLGSKGYSAERTSLKLADLAARQAIAVAAAQAPADPQAPPSAS